MFKLDIKIYSEILLANLANCYRILLAKPHLFNQWAIWLVDSANPGGQSIDRRYGSEQAGSSG